MEATTPLFLQGNALHLPLPDNSVDLIVTSPPYFGLRDYGAGAHEIGSEATPAEFLDALVTATAEMARVLRPTGSIWVNLGDKYSQRTQTRRSSHQPGMHEGKFEEFEETWAERAAAGAVRMPHQNVPAPGVAHVPEKSLMGLPWRYAIRCVDELGLVLREEVIWAKPNGLPESVKDRCARKHEQWFHFTVSPRYFAAMDLLREEYSTSGECPGGGNTSRAMRKAGAEDTNQGGAGYHALGKLPGSVWTVATEPLRVPEELGVKHFAAFPSEWPRRIVLGWCPPGGTVLDPFSGTGTTAIVANALGCQGIGIDLNADYIKLARWRAADGKLAAKVVERTHGKPARARGAKPAPPEQPELF